MKKFVFLFVLIIMCVFSVAFKSDTVNSFPLFGKTIVLDIGHGDEDPGSINGGEFEKDYNLDFGKCLNQILSMNGANVVMVRTGDYDLANPNSSKRKRSDFDNRINLIDGVGADLYISLHMNYLSDSKYYGSQAFYSDVNENNQVIANQVQDELNKFFDYNKSARKIGNDKYMYRNIKTKGILLEFGFMSSKKDRDNLKIEKYKYELSTVIMNALIKYFT